MTRNKNLDSTSHCPVSKTSSDTRKIPVHREVVYTLIILFLTYAVVEVVMSSLYAHGMIEPESIWLQENTGNGSTIQFDPIRGYRLSTIPSRMVVVASNGTVESVGTVRGNNEGFPDRDDISPRRSHPDTKRFAVFGDSFTAAQFMSQNWPDLAEDLSRDSHSPLELLNFSVDGGGIVNWWSVLTRFVEPNGYEIDGVIFAVCCGDLKRGFAIWDDGGTFSGSDEMPGMVFGRVPTFNPTRLPATFEEALPHVWPLSPWKTISSLQLDQLLQGDYRVPFQRPFKLYIAQRVQGIVGRFMNVYFSWNQVDNLKESSQPLPFNASPTFDAGRKRLVDDIRRFLRSKRIPSLVVHVPTREVLLEGTGPPEDPKNFAAALQADFVDGSFAFKELTQREIKAAWLPYDGHWGEGASNLFAQFMVKVLADWPSHKLMSS